MRRLVLGTGAIAALSAIGFVVLTVWPIGATPSPELANLTGDVNRGAYLARASGCIACHTNPEGGAPLAGSVKLDTPFGTLYSPNLTTDPEQGIGNWTIEQFAIAVRQGISPEGEPYYPAFTYPFYGDFTDQEIADLWAAFQTVPAVETPSRAPEMAFPFNQRAGLKLWRALFQFDPKQSRSLVEVTAGTGANGWSKGRHIAPHAIRPATCWVDERSRRQSSRALICFPVAARRPRSTPLRLSEKVGTPEVCLTL